MYELVTGLAGLRRSLANPQLLVIKDAAHEMTKTMRITITITKGEIEKTEIRP